MNESESKDGEVNENISGSDMKNELDKLANKEDIEVTTLNKEGLNNWIINKNKY